MMKHSIQEQGMSFHLLKHTLVFFQQTLSFPENYKFFFI